VEGAGALPEQAHAVLAPGDQRGGAAQQAQDARAGCVEVRLPRDPDPRGLLGLHLVGGDQGDATIMGEVADLGIDQHRSAAGLSDHVPHEPAHTPF
jgi:hypothetical protein